MILSEDIKAQADNYLDNNMSEIERNAFEQELKGNKLLQEYLAINKEMAKQYSDSDWQFLEQPNTSDVNVLEDYLKSDDINKLKEAIKMASTSYHQNKVKKKPSKSVGYSFLAIAASIVLLIGLYFAGSNDNIYEDYNSWNELPSLIERGDALDSNLEQAENAFVKKNFNLANTLYLQYLKESTNESNVTVYLYLGITELELKQKEKALAYFDNVITSNSIDFSKGYWYKALVYLKFEEHENAKKQLRIITQEQSNYNYKEAKKLLKKLN